MIAVDSSAIISILLDEPEGPTFANALEHDLNPILSAPTLVEVLSVARRRLGQQGAQLAMQLLIMGDVRVVPFTHELALIAAEAGRQYPILNFGDTFSYAIAKHFNVPLLYKGNDFSSTDIQPAI